MTPENVARDGFYWVRRQSISDWEPAKWHARSAMWYLCGFVQGMDVFLVGREIEHDGVTIVVDKKGRRVEVKSV